MERITTGSIITNNVVNDWDFFSSPFWKWFNKMCIHQSMNVFQPTFKVDVPISLTGKSFPYPTITDGVYFYFGEDFVKKTCREIWNCEILNDSHDSSSCDGLGLGSGRCQERLSDPSILSESVGLSRENYNWNGGS